MSSLIAFFRSTVGAKVLMSLTGAGLVLFVLAHLAGNLQVYLGQEQFNAYAYALKSNPLVLWGLRTTLLVGVTLHIFSAVRLKAINRSARPQGYVTSRHYQAAWLPGRTMFWTGLLVFAFIAYHLAHFTLGLTNPEQFHLTDSLGHHDAYTMFVLGFRDPAISALYITAQGLLGLHLAHGVTSMFQSLGLNGARTWPWLARLGPTLAVLVVLGNISMPIAVMQGIVKLPPGVG